jgi:hypothetical protein
VVGRSERRSFVAVGVGDNVKVKLSLCLIKHHGMKKYVGVEIYFHTFLTSILDGSEWSASHQGIFTPGENVPDTH